MKKVLSISLFIFSCLILFPFHSFAEEGMWLPIFLKDREAEMKEMGMRIGTDHIYSEDTSLKDAVVMFGKGCTGEFVSSQGLLFTNHHCGYGMIQFHSTLENDYLSKGYWAKGREEELVCPGLEVRILKHMEDVSPVVAKAYEGKNLNNDEKKQAIRKVCDSIEKAIHQSSGLEAIVKPLYSGNKYFVWVNEVFKDVRLVGAPPSNIGKFGGDTDNWVWPRHTGDFAVFRVYADSLNQAADYHINNRPYQAKKHFEISLDGLNEGDFSFVFGYPGSTREYISSYAIKSISETENPITIESRTKRLHLIKEAQLKDPFIRIQYAAKVASIANRWKKLIGENKGLEKLRTIEEKEKYEDAFRTWTKETEEGAPYYGLLGGLKSAYQEIEPYVSMLAYYNEAVCAPEIVKFSLQFKELLDLCTQKKASKKEIEDLVEKLKKKTENYFKNYNAPLDKEIFLELSLMEDKDTKESFRLIDLPDYPFPDYVHKIYKESMFCNEKACMDFLNQFKKKNYKIIENDFAYIYAKSVENAMSPIRSAEKLLSKRIDSLQSLYMKAQMEFDKDRDFYPDANFTLRVSYGKVQGYKPKDATYYQHQTYLDGLIAKEDPEIYDYVVEDKLKELYKKKDFGIYAAKNGKMPIAFIASNHTTGGNSGSPVLNADGKLIGINFDRTWEGTMSDLDYDPDICRNISLDIRFCLFIIDKFAGASYLIDEMNINNE